LKKLGYNNHILNGSLADIYTKFQFFELLHKSLTIDQVNCWSPVALRFTSRFCCIRTSGNHQSLIGPANHGPPKIAYDGRTNTALESLALKDHVEREETADPHNTFPIDTSITRTPRDLNLNETRFPKQTLTKPFERVWRHPANTFQQLLFPA